MIDIIVVNYNTKETTKKAIDSIYKFTDLDAFKLFLVDGNSTDGSQEYFKELLNNNSYNFQLVCLSSNRGVGPARNVILKSKAREGNDVVFMDSDAEIRAGGWLPAMQALLQGNVGKVEAKVEIHDGTKQFGGTVFQLTKREVFDTIGVFDENFFSAEDEDWRCRFMAAGFKTAYCKTTNVFHQGGGTLELVLKDGEHGSPVRKKGDRMFKEKYTQEYLNLYHCPSVYERNKQPLD